MVLNALNVDPLRKWDNNSDKTIWRWYSDNMITCCQSLDETRDHGTPM